ENYLPLNNGDTMTFRWTNSKHMPKPSTQRFTVAQVVNNTSRVDVKNLSGPISVAGSYVFASRLSGVTNLSTFTRAASKAKFPPHKGLVKLVFRHRDGSVSTVVRVH